MLSHTTLLFGLVASASAHMVMTNPKPFNSVTLNNSPLGPADFPCKQRAGVYTVDNNGMNMWNAGETKTVTFMGSAVHGGGSCQFSITTDAEPTKDSQWKVIQSVEGNCLTTTHDNLFPTDPSSDKSTPIPVKMPSNIPDGRYTFAWSWLNKMGNREFYMNCAPIQVGSSSTAASAESAGQALSALPDMFVANLPSKDTPPEIAMGLPTCTTNGDVDFKYPAAGQNVMTGTVENNPNSAFDGPGCAAQTKMGAGAGKIGSPSAGTPSTPYTPSKSSGAPSPSKPSEKPAASPAAPVKGEPQQSKIPTNPNGGAFAPGASSAPVAVPTPQPSPPAANPAPATPPQTGSDNNTTPVNSDCTPCTNEGGVVCIGTKQFGLCNRGCAVAQDLAAGMSCVGGAVVGSTKKRAAFPRAYLARRFSHAHHGHF